MEVKEIINGAIALGACSESGKASDWRSLAWLFFSPQGIEFCRKHDYPTLDVFRGADNGISYYGVYVDSDPLIENEDIALIGDCNAELRYSGTDKPYKVILMHGAKAKIHAGMYAAVKIENISGEYDVFNDGTATVK